jgi:hypothetical protein
LFSIPGERIHELYEAHAAVAAIDQDAEQGAIDDREGIATEPIIDDELGDGTEWMNID